MNRVLRSLTILSGILIAAVAAAPALGSAIIGRNVTRATLAHTEPSPTASPCGVP